MARHYKRGFGCCNAVSARGLRRAIAQAHLQARGRLHPCCHRAAAQLASSGFFLQAPPGISQLLTQSSLRAYKCHLRKPTISASIVVSEPNAPPRRSLVWGHRCTCYGSPTRQLHNHVATSSCNRGMLRLSHAAMSLKQGEGGPGWKWNSNES